MNLRKLMKLLLKNFLFGALFLFVFVLFNGVSYAKSPSFTFVKLDAGAGSRIFLDDVKPGETVSGVLRISLMENVPTIFEIFFVDNMGNKFDKLNLSETDLKYFTYDKWIQLDVESPIYLEGMGSMEIPYTISVPVGALPGDYAGSFVATVNSYGEKAVSAIENYVPGENFGSGAKVKIGIAIEFLMRVSGDVTPILDLKDVSYYKEQATEKFNVVLSYENKGNVALLPKARLRIENIWGRELYSGEFVFPVVGPYKEVSSVMKLSTRDFYFDYGIYDVNVELYYDVFSRSLGENLVYLSGNALMKVYYFPWYFFAILFLILILVSLRFFYKNVRVFFLAKNAKVYLVRPNDTLQIISTKFKIDPKYLILLNKLKPPYFLTTGQKLLIPFQNKNEKKKI
ncbi:MAG: LysM peptidoglycan-binding domain-containing protein [Candidatus Gracilibacteria bacterium]|jgi:hypothetical protein|nr:LysM peptidoglycan-binding domain-containing protein [Candidatus Gracilibacteria bacterium]